MTIPLVSRAEVDSLGGSVGDRAVSDKVTLSGGRVLEEAATAPKRLRLLCPFDPLVRDRKRLERFFGFEYRFEAFVPRPQRVYGYYVLPMLVGDGLVGRLDGKFHHREGGVLEVLGCGWEGRESESALQKELRRLALRIGVERVVLPPC